MPHPLLTVPASHRVGLTSISLGLLRCLDRGGINVGFYKPVAQLRHGPRDRAGLDVERSSALVREISQLHPPAPLSAQEAEALLAKGAADELEQIVVSAYQSLAKNHDAIVIEGLVPTDEYPFATRVNRMIADALDAEVILIAEAQGRDIPSLIGDIRIASLAFGTRVKGCILNRVESRGRSSVPSMSASPRLSAVMARTGSSNQHRQFSDQLEAIEKAGIRALGAVPTVQDFSAMRISDLAEQLGARVIAQGDWEHRRVRSTKICAMRVEHAQRAFVHGSLIVVPSDRADILVGAALATLNGVELAGILLSGVEPPDAEVLRFCGPALSTGLPILHVAESTYDVVKLLHQLNDEIPPTDHERASLVMNTVANHIDTAWVAELGRVQHAARLSPAAFRHRLVEQARATSARIVLPEGTEPRILSAAQVCLDMGLARPILLGSRDEVLAAARRAGVDLPEDIEILSPLTPPESYINKLIELRRGKGVDTPEKALDALSDVTTFGTMMMKMGDADGLVSGAVHSTAHTIRPALQLIKTRPGAALVSSVFFMCLPDQVMVFGDCAVNPNPDAEQLADIAIQSAESALAFGIVPRVAMISYSTGSSGAGSDVEKVRQATELARKRAPDLLIDGPMQYDAAVNLEVAKTKAPDSPVAGRATVLIFPDLNTGNTTYKAVQRSAHVLSIGPMLQGLAAPVNDLSRGATVDDIVYTIALTAIQSAAERQAAGSRRPAMGS